MDRIITARWLMYEDTHHLRVFLRDGLLKTEALETRLTYYHPQIPQIRLLKSHRNCQLVLNDTHPLQGTLQQLKLLLLGLPTALVAV